MRQVFVHLAGEAGGTVVRVHEDEIPNAEEMHARLKHHALVQRLVDEGAIHDPERALFDIRRKDDAKAN